MKSDTSPNQITYDHTSLSDYISNTESNLQPQHDQSLNKQLIPKISAQFSPKLHTHANVTSNTHTDKITPRSTGNVKPYTLCVKPFHTKPRTNAFASLEGRRKEVIEGRSCPWTKEAKSIFLQVGVDIVDRIVTEDLGLEIKEISLEIDEGKPQTERSDESDSKEDSRSQKGESETEGKESDGDSDKKQWRKSSADVSKIFSQQPKYQMGAENMRSLKDVVDKVVKEHKTFCVEGSYGAIRNAMKKRGWLEKREPRWTPKRSNHNGNSFN
ncbi:unnamed protein product [Timema podura]|uniref:Uncharacterized protein n=1 Tax=Timema podura TaxID=61482 RepID=A0ABN7PFW4_TIMPD|nr:unnamed protein product [Timema podura]